MDRQTHWNTVYSTKGEPDVSGFEALPDASLRMMEAAALTAEPVCSTWAEVILASSIVSKLVEQAVRPR